MKIYCRNCNERIKQTPDGYKQISHQEFINPSECRATGGEHVPR